MEGIVSVVRMWNEDRRWAFVGFSLPLSLSLLLAKTKNGGECEDFS
jgi:hypothetical protein